jgi:hypothetical protein
VSGKASLVNLCIRTGGNCLDLQPGLPPLDLGDFGHGGAESLGQICHGHGQAIEGALYRGRQSGRFHQDQGEAPSYRTIQRYVNETSKSGEALMCARGQIIRNCSPGVIASVPA